MTTVDDDDIIHVHIITVALSNIIVLYTRELCFRR